MKITVRVKAGCKEVKVEKTGERQFTVRVKAPAKEGRANIAVIEALAEYFDRPKSAIEIIAGASCKNKILDIS